MESEKAGGATKALGSVAGEGAAAAMLQVVKSGTAGGEAGMAEAKPGMARVEAATVEAEAATVEVARTVMGTACTAEMANAEEGTVAQGVQVTEAPMETACERRRP